MSRHKDNGKLVKDCQRDDKVLNRTEMETGKTSHPFNDTKLFMIVVADWQ